MERKEAKQLFKKLIVDRWKERAAQIPLTQVELAKSADISEEHLSRIINGLVKNPHERTLLKIENIFKKYKV